MRYNCYFEPPEGLCEKIIQCIRHKRRVLELRKKIIKLSAISLLVIASGATFYTKTSNNNNIAQSQPSMPIVASTQEVNIVQTATESFTAFSYPVLSSTRNPVFIRTAGHRR